MTAIGRSGSQPSLGSNGCNAMLLGANPSGRIDMRDVSATLPCIALSPKALPSSSSDSLGSRPGSGQRKSNSMVRLSDEVQSTSPTSVTQRERVRTPPSALKGGRDVLSPSSRPGSSSSGRASSLTRLPEDFLHTPAAQPKPLDQCAVSAVKATSSTDRGPNHRLRDRFNKPLSVATHGMPDGVQVFRLLTAAQNIEDYYVVDEEIYSAGSKGKVVIARRRSDDVEVVIKIRAKSANRSCERTLRAIMGQVHELGGTRHVLNIMEIIESDDSFYVVMPKCTGGELFEFLANEAEVPEAECKRIIREILIAVGHLHANNLIHRDIKPENIMFDVVKTPGLATKSPKTVKLIDFDTCFEWTPATPKSRRFVGTPGYIAPEALMGEVSPKSDLWSIGVILYILMTGEMPWSSLVSLEDGIVGSPGARQMYRQLKAEVLSWDEEPWPDFPLARDLCQKLLAFRTEERMSTVEQALLHPWLRVEGPQ